MLVWLIDFDYCEGIGLLLSNENKEEYDVNLRNLIEFFYVFLFWR